MADTSRQVSNVRTGGSPHLYVGSSNGITSTARARFYRPTKPYSITADSARFALAWQGGIGSGQTPDVEGRLAILKWAESDTVFDTTGSAASIPLSSRFDSVPGDTGFMSFNIPLDWITSWLNWVDSSAIDTGWSDPLRPDSALTLLLSAPSANDRILRFRSRSATSDSLRPRLLIYAVIKDSAEDVPHSYLYSLAAGGDLFEAWDANPLPLGRLVLGGGAGIRSAIKFDLAPIWSAKAVSDIVINRAIVTLHRDSTLYTWAPLSRWVWPYVMTSNLWMSQFASAEYAGYAASADSLNVAAGLIALKATSPTASWAKSDTVNFGLMLQAGSEALDLERVAYYGISSPDSTLWPKLTIYYTELPR